MSVSLDGPFKTSTKLFALATLLFPKLPLKVELAARLTVRVELF